MCNLYSSYATQAGMRQAFNVTRDSAGNVPPLSAIFPDQMAPVIRNHEGERELIRMRWGFPPPPKVGQACWIKAGAALCDKDQMRCDKLPDHAPARIIEYCGGRWRVQTAYGTGWVSERMIMMDCRAMSPPYRC